MLESSREFRKINLFERKLRFSPFRELYDPLKMSLTDGDLAVVDDLFSYRQYNDFLTQFSAAGAIANPQAGTIQHLTGTDLWYGYLTAAAWDKIISESDLKDEDNMASDSASHAATQQSIKAYADTKDLKIKVINFTRDLAAASADVGYTGIGFQPLAASFHLCDETTSTTFASWGSDDGTNHRVIYTPAAFGSVYAEEAISLYGQQGAVDHQQAFIKTFDVDGFTLTWTKTGNPTGTLHVNCTVIGQE